MGDIGYFDEVARNWVFLHIPEMVDWSTSALAVEGNTIWAGLVRYGEGAPEAGGLLRYDLASHKATVIRLPDAIDKILQVRTRIYCGTSRGFAIVEQDTARRFEFTPQLNGSYAVTPAVTPAP